MPTTRSRRCAVAGMAAATLLLTCIASTSALAAACQIGETAAPSTSDNTEDWTGITVYQLLDPADCAACAGSPLVLDQVIWQWRYYQTLCPLTFEVAVVATDHGACPRPDDSITLCPAFTYVYQATGAAPHFVTIPFPTGCCIAGQAFVRIHLVDAGGCPRGSIAPLGRGPCTGPCRAYAVAPSLFPLTDACDVLGYSPTIRVGADCCPPTPSRPRTWGGMKLIYR